MTNSKLFFGDIIHSVDGKIEIMEKTFILVENKVITYIGTEKPKKSFDEVFELQKNQLLIPGLIDTHIHAPQYCFCGCGLDLPLLEWLEKYTFPAESKFNSIEYAKDVYSKVVDKTLASGTTTACYFATIWMESSLLLADICKLKGQRAFVGKVSMDCNSPDFYVEKTEDAIRDVASFVAKLYNKDELVQPAITPRFVPTCTQRLMESMGELHKKYPVIIQSHVSENLGEIDWVKKLYPNIPSYTGVYDKFGLLTPKTILAHGVHLTDDEIKLLAEKGGSIAHCPESNFQLFSGCCDVRRLQAAGVTVGLGSDIAGSASTSMIDCMRYALINSRAIMIEKRNRRESGTYNPLTVKDVLSLATEGSAKALGIFDKVGNFVVGKQFDALVVDLNRGAVDCFGNESITNLLEKFVNQADDRNIIRVYVGGKLVKQEI